MSANSQAMLQRWCLRFRDNLGMSCPQGDFIFTIFTHINHKTHHTLNNTNTNYSFPMPRYFIYIYIYVFEQTAFQAAEPTQKPPEHASIGSNYHTAIAPCESVVKYSSICTHMNTPMSRFFFFCLRLGELFKDGNTITDCPSILLNDEWQRIDNSESYIVSDFFNVIGFCILRFKSKCWIYNNQGVLKNTLSLK